MAQSSMLVLRVELQTLLVNMLVVIVLMFGLNTVGGQSTVSDLEYNCTSNDSIPHLSASTSMSGNLTSPCYPDSYGDLSCVTNTYRNETCYVRLDDLRVGSWVGFFYSEEFTMYGEDYVKISRSRKNLSGIHFSEHDLLDTFDATHQTNAYIEFHQHPSTSAPSSQDTYTFLFTYVVAYTVSQNGSSSHTAAPAGTAGYIVSHKNFNFTDNFRDSVTSSLTLTGLSNKSRLILSFEFFKLVDYQYWHWWGWLLWKSWKCPIDLRIQGIRGNWQNYIKYCGHDIPPTSLPVYPEEGNITFILTAESDECPGYSAGFYIKYEVYEMTECPPHIPNAVVTKTNYTDRFSVTCNSGYKTRGDSDVVQEVTCVKGLINWGSFISCTEIVCTLPTELTSAASNSTALNFTLSSNSSLKPGTTITYWCAEDYVLSMRENTSLCGDRGEWSLTVPKCHMITSTSTSTTRSDDEGSSNSERKDAPSKAAYIGAGIGGAVGLILIILLVVLVLRRRRILPSKSTRERAVPKGEESLHLTTTFGKSNGNRGSSGGGGCGDGSGGGGREIYSLADEESSGNASQDAKRVVREDNTYDLADPLNDAYENTSAIDRSERERHIPDVYTNVLAATKARKPNPAIRTEMEMCDNELYGT